MRKRLENIILATQNKGKIKEIKYFLSALPLNILTLEEVNIKVTFNETGFTYWENALKKAHQVYKLTGEPVLAEDSGLEVIALKNAPGIFSARIAKNDFERNLKVLEALKDIPWKARVAKFVSWVVLLNRRGKALVANGECWGVITYRVKGNFGFGYDPIFWSPVYQKTFGEVSSEAKNKVSHRARAFEKIKPKIINFLAGA
jgi:XTP/dITP diphosphohydrolase